MDLNGAIEDAGRRFPRPGRRRLHVVELCGGARLHGLRHERLQQSKRHNCNILVIIALVEGQFCAALIYSTGLQPQAKNKLAAWCAFQPMRMQHIRWSQDREIKSLHHKCRVYASGSVGL